MNKYILVTASSRGLGLEIARTLSYEGFSIIYTARSKEKLEATLKELNPNIQHKGVCIDFSHTNSAKTLYEEIKELKIHSIVHNLGAKLDNDKHEIDMQVMYKSIHLNFGVSVEINNLLAKKLNGEPSKIIHIGSTASLHTKASPSYTLSKSLINTYVKNISFHYAKMNILIVAVLPGILAHEGSDWFNKKEEDITKYNEILKKQALGKFSLPDDISPYIIDIINQKNLLSTGSCLKLDANEY